MISDNVSRFNQIAESWARIATLDPSIRDAALDAAGLPANGIILDAGCGSGILLPALLARIGKDGRIVALDSARRMLAIAARTCPDPRVSYVCADVSDYRGDDGSFDVVICCRLLHHLRDPAAALARISGWLRPAGRLVVFDGEAAETVNADARTLPLALSVGGFEVCSSFHACGLSAWVCRKAGGQAWPDGMR